MARRADALKAKQARQKKVAIGLGLVLVLVMAYQGPKTLKMLKGPSAAAAPVATAAPATPVTPVTPVTPGTTPLPAVTPSTPGSPQPAILADSETTFAPSAGQLLSFERFESTDPFKQQVEAGSSATPVETSGGSTGAVGDEDGGAAPAPKPAAPAAPEPVAPVVPPAPAAPETPPATDTTVSVNGVVEVVSETAPFPAEDPTFELVSLGNDGKSVEIGIAGGSISGGSETVKLVIGKPLTLQNTANGSRYKLVLLTVKGAVPPSK